jgi:hypothetical protein
MSDFRRVADDVRNWGRWGDDDELGTLNLITSEKVAQAAALVKHGKVFPLGVDFGSSGPQGAFHYRQNPVHVMTIDGGDTKTLVEYGPKWLRNPSAVQLSGYSEAGPMRFNDDMIIMPLQAATQWDALSHVYYEDQLYNGFPARASPRAVYCSTSSSPVASKRIVPTSSSRSRLPNSMRRRRRKVSPSRPATSSSSTPVGGQGFSRLAMVASLAPDWTGRVRRGYTTTRSPPWPPTI